MNCSSDSIKQVNSLTQAGLAAQNFRSTSLQLQLVEEVTLLKIHSLESVGSSTMSLAGSDLMLPMTTGQSFGSDPAALCLRPQEWMLFSEIQDGACMMSDLQAAFDPLRTALIDLSHGLTVFRLSGPGAPWLLSKLSCLDFLFGHSGTQHCARTRIGHSSVLVHYHQAGDDKFCFDLIFDRSIAKYMWALLTESSAHADDLTATHASRL